MENKTNTLFSHHQGSSLSTRTAKNLLYSIAGFVWPIFLLLFSIPYFIHKLGAEQYGIWVLLMSTVGMMGVLNFGIGDALVKFISEYNEKNDLCSVNYFVGNSFFIYLIISVIVVFLGLFALPYFVSFLGIKESYKEISSFVLRIAIFGFVFNMLLINALAIFRAIQRYDISSKVTMITNTIKTLSMITILYLGFGLKGMVIANVGGIIVGLLLTLILLTRVAPEINLRLSFNIEVMKKIFGFSFYSFLMGISNIIKANVGNILVGRYLGAEYVPYLSVPRQVSVKILEAVSSLATVFFPVFSSLNGANELDKIKSIFNDASKFIGILGLVIGATMFAFSYSFLKIWINPEFAAIANLPFRILIIGFTFASAAAVAYFYLLGSGHIKVAATVQALSMLLTLGLGLILTPVHGIIGISISYTVANLILTIYIYYSAKNIWFRNWFAQVLRIYICSTASSVLAAILITWFVQMKINTFLNLFLYAALFAMILIILNMSLDRHFLLNYLKIRSSLKSL